MDIEPLVNLIKNSDLPTMQKNMLTGFVKRSIEDDEKRRQDIKLIEEFGLHGREDLSEILLSTHAIKIYKVTGKEDWAIMYPYRSLYLNDKGNWIRCSTVSDTLDAAILVCLGQKHLGANTQFPELAMKMLEMEFPK